MQSEGNTAMRKEGNSAASVLLVGPSSLIRHHDDDFQQTHVNAEAYVGRRSVEACKTFHYHPTRGSLSSAAAFLLCSSRQEATMSSRAQHSLKGVILRQSCGRASYQRWKIRGKDQPCF